MNFIRNNKPVAALGGLLGVAVVAWLAFGFFGIQAAFIDNEVNMADPFAVQTVAADAGDATTDDADSTDGAGDNDSGADDGADAPAAADDAAAPFVETSGSFIPLEHAVTGEATIISDGERRFLRFEDFEVDNGPDLFVYLVAGASADGDKDLFDDDFVNLGRLAGNVGDQNYEVDIDLDLDRYNTVVIWCDRFNASFAAADLV